MKDYKRDYLIKTFSRTKRKDYENYILNAIWHKLDRSDIQPVTQQYIQWADGKYALLDLYFPQLNIGIECDEEYHINNSKKDQQREITMEQMLSLYKETSDFKLYRIKAYESIVSIDKQIEEIVGKINRKIIQIDFKPWNCDEDDIRLAKAKGNISVNDRFQFRTIADICRCFGKNPISMQSAFFYLGNNYQLWCPKLAIEKNGKYNSVSSGWINILSDDWDIIWETNDDISKIDKNNPKIYPNRKKIVFGRSKNILGITMYRFLGIYKMDLESTNINGHLYKRISQSIDLVGFEQLHSDLTDGILDKRP